MKLRILPEHSEFGWTPILLLVWSLPFLLTPLFSGAQTFEWVVTAVGYAAFLVLWFTGWWLRGPRLYWIVAGLVTLGLIFSPFNLGGGCFFIYGASFLGEAANRRNAYRMLLLLVAIIAVEGLLVALPFAIYLPAMIISVVIGVLTINDAEARRRNARLRLAQEEVESLAKLDERERIGRDLHDLLGHTLSVINLKSQLAVRLSERDPERAVAEMREVERVSREAMQEVRRAVMGYRAQKLGTELARVRMALEAAAIQLDLETCPDDLEAEQESVLALALREAVTNVIKHSQATRCAIRTIVGDGELLLEVEDNGRGLGDGSLDVSDSTEAAGRRFEGTGLDGMRERLETVGGRLEVLPAERRGRGTLIRVSVPSSVSQGPDLLAGEC